MKIPLLQNRGDLNLRIVIIADISAGVSSEIGLVCVARNAKGPNVAFDDRGTDGPHEKTHKHTHTQTSLRIGSVSVAIWIAFGRGDLDRFRT